MYITTWCIYDESLVTEKCSFFRNSIFNSISRKRDIFYCGCVCGGCYSIKIILFIYFFLMQFFFLSIEKEKQRIGFFLRLTDFVLRLWRKHIKPYIMYSYIEMGIIFCKKYKMKKIHIIFPCVFESYRHYALWKLNWIFLNFLCNKLKRYEYYSHTLCIKDTFRAYHTLLRYFYATNILLFS